MHACTNRQDDGLCVGLNLTPAPCDLPTSISLLYDRRLQLQPLQGKLTVLTPGRACLLSLSTAAGPQVWHAHGDADSAEEQCNSLGLLHKAWLQAAPQLSRAQWVC